MAMLPFILFSYHSVLIFGTTKYLHFYALAKSSHVQILQFCILVKLYRVCRAVFYHVAGTGSHEHVKTSASALPACILVFKGCHTP
jgi:hypothetical protein